MALNISNREKIHYYVNGDFVCGAKTNTIVFGVMVIARRKTKSLNVIVFFLLDSYIVYVLLFLIIEISIIVPYRLGS